MAVPAQHAGNAEAAYAHNRENPDAHDAPYNDLTLPSPQALEKFLEPILPPDFARMFTELHQDLRAIRDQIAHQRLPNIDDVIAVGGTPQVADTILHTMGRHYNMLWVPTSPTLALTFQLLTGPVTVTLNQGWNALHLPDGTRINSSVATTTLLILRRTDDAQGGLF